MTPQQRFYGWRRSNPDQRDYMFGASRRVLQNLPPSIDLNDPSVGVPFDPCWDQGTIGSCGPSSLAESITYDILTDSPGTLKEMPSRLFSYYVSRMLMDTVKSDSGVDNRTMLKALSQYGWCDESDWPYIESKFATKPSSAAFTKASTRTINEYTAVPQDLNQMKACLVGNPSANIKGRPFIFGFTVYESFESEEVTKTGIVPLPEASESVKGGHDVLAVGYDDSTRRMKMKNHWGVSWGDKGYFYMPYAYCTDPKLSGDFWVVNFAQE